MLQKLEVGYEEEELIVGYVLPLNTCHSSPRSFLKSNQTTESAIAYSRNNFNSSHILLDYQEEILVEGNGSPLVISTSQVKASLITPANHQINSNTTLSSCREDGYEEEELTMRQFPRISIFIANNSTHSSSSFANSISEEGLERHNIFPERQIVSSPLTLDSSSISIDAPTMPIDINEKVEFILPESSGLSTRRIVSTHEESDFEDLSISRYQKRIRMA